MNHVLLLKNVLVIAKKLQVVGIQPQSWKSFSQSQEQFLLTEITIETKFQIQGIELINE